MTQQHINVNILKQCLNTINLVYNSGYLATIWRNIHTYCAALWFVSQELQQCLGYPCNTHYREKMLATIHKLWCGSLGSIAAFHCPTILFSDFHRGYTASSELKLVDWTCQVSVIVFSRSDALFSIWCHINNIWSPFTHFNPTKEVTSHPMLADMAALLAKDKLCHHFLILTL